MICDWLRIDWFNSFSSRLVSGWVVVDVAAILTDAAHLIAGDRDRAEYYRWLLLVSAAKTISSTKRASNHAPSTRRSMPLGGESLPLLPPSLPPPSNHLQRIPQESPTLRSFPSPPTDNKTRATNSERITHGSRKDHARITQGSRKDRGRIMEEKWSTYFIFIGRLICRKSPWRTRRSSTWTASKPISMEVWSFSADLKVFSYSWLILDATLDPSLN